jgi:hypothetical protein
MAIQSPKSSAVAAAAQKISGQLLLAPGEVVRYAARLDRNTLDWGTLVLAALLLLSAILIFGVIERNAKAFLTSDRLYKI